MSAAPYPLAGESLGGKPAVFDDCSGAESCPRLVAAPAGAFVMGSPPSESGRFDDEKRQRVDVAAFAVAESPVTRGQWRTVVDSTHRRTPIHPARTRSPSTPRGGLRAFRRTIATLAPARCSRGCG